MADDGSGALAFLVFLGLLGLAVYGLARKGRLPRVAPRRRNLQYVPMRAADAHKARQASWWTGRVNGGMTAQEFQAGRTLPTDGGDLVRSQAEVRIANELRRMGLRYEYEPMVCGFRPDFFLPDHGIVIEYWGLDEPKYNASRRTKTAAYLRAGYALVSLGPGKGISVERDLGRQLWHKLRGA